MQYCPSSIEHILLKPQPRFGDNLTLVPRKLSPKRDYGSKIGRTTQILSGSSRELHTSPKTHTKKKASHDRKQFQRLDIPYHTYHQQTRTTLDGKCRDRWGINMKAGRSLRFRPEWYSTNEIANTTMQVVVPQMRSPVSEGLQILLCKS